MPDVITHLIYYSITIQVVVLAFGFKEKKSVRQCGRVKACYLF